MSEDAAKKLTAFYMIGSTFRKQREKREEIYEKVRDNIKNMSEDEIRMLYDLCDDREKDLLNEIREDKA